MRAEALHWFQEGFKAGQRASRRRAEDPGPRVPEAWHREEAEPDLQPLISVLAEALGCPGTGRRGLLAGDLRKGEPMLAEDVPVITLPGPGRGDYDAETSLAIIEVGPRPALNVDTLTTIVTRAVLAEAIWRYASRP